MSAFLLQHQEREVYSLSFANRLAQGETISSILEVSVLRSLPTRLADRTSEFEISHTEQDGVVQVTLGGKGTDPIAPGHYALKIRVQTSHGRVLTGMHKVVISEGRT